MNRSSRFLFIKLIQTYYNSFFFFFLLVLAFAIPTSRLLMSMSQIGLALLWILDARYREKLQGFFHNRIALLLSSLFLLHLVGLLYTSDIDAALKDLRIKLPLLLLPFFLSSAAPFNRQKALWILMAFVAGVFYASAFVSIEYWFSHQDIQTILSDRFIKHMRFSLNINLAIFSLVLIAVYERKKWPDRIFISAIVLWLFIFMLKMGAMTAYVLFVILLLFLAISVLMRSKGKNIVWGLSVLGLALILFGYFALAFLRPVFFKSKITEISSLEQKTVQGNDYNRASLELTENGKPIYIYICEKELKPEWAKRSRLPYSGSDKKGQELKATLFRYLTSLDLRKDSLGLSKLSNQDIQNIENGIANANYVGSPAYKIRLMQLAFELEQYKSNPNPSGYSLGQRLEYWKVSWYEIKKAWVFGYGTGENDMVMQEGYRETDSLLSPDLWFRPHNQFLSFWLNFGIFGLLLFLVVLIYPPLWNKAFSNPFYTMFFISVLLSFFVEDTLETQSGATYFAFFNAFFLLLWPGNAKGRWSEEEQGVL